MDRRLQLQEILEKILGSEHVYFSPTENIQMKYPCIVFTRDTGDTTFADGRAYRFTVRYQITAISRDPDSEVIHKLAELPMCVFDRHYISDGLNHDTFNCYY